MYNDSMIRQIISSKAIEYVLCLAESENISKAAEKLYISQPALSSYIKNIEQAIGCPLFERRNKKIIPTYAGECFLRYARIIHNTENLMARELTNCAANTAGRIRLGLPQLRSSYVLPQVVPEFQRVYPDVELEIYEKHADSLTTLWNNYELDIMIANFVPADCSTHHTIISSDRMLIAMAPDDPIAALADPPEEGEKYGSMDMRLLKDEKFILQPSNQRTRQMADAICREAGFEPSPELLVRSLEASLRMVRQGCGVCFCSESMANSISLSDPPLYFLCRPNSIMELAICYRDLTHQPEYYRYFLDLLCTRILNRSPEINELNSDGKKA